jgi:hypothetical protein
MSNARGSQSVSGDSSSWPQQMRAGSFSGYEDCRGVGIFRCQHIGFRSALYDLCVKEAQSAARLAVRESSGANSFKMRSSEKRPGRPLTPGNDRGPATNFLLFLHRN